MDREINDWVELRVLMDDLGLCEKNQQMFERDSWKSGSIKITPRWFLDKVGACLVDSIVCGILTEALLLSDFSVPVFNNSNEVVGYLKITYGF